MSNQPHRPRSNTPKRYPEHEIIWLDTPKDDSEGELSFQYIVAYFLTDTIPGPSIKQEYPSRESVDRAIHETLHTLEREIEDTDQFNPQNIRAILVTDAYLCRGCPSTF